VHVHVQVLGEFEVTRRGVALTPSAPKLRRVFALLAIRANRVVRIDQIIEELWEDRPPFSATTTLQTYVYQLRKLLAWSMRNDETSGQGDTPEVALRTTPSGYLLSLPKGALDADRFEQLAAEGREKISAGEFEAASEMLREALQLWSGPAFSAVNAGPLLQAEIVRLEELRKIVLGHRIEVDLQLGRHLELIGELTTMVAQQPTHEGFQAKLMLGLYRAGRRSEALQAYQRTRTALAEELGLEPSTELRQLHQAILTADPSLDAPATGLSTIHVAAKAEPPDQLPVDVPRLIGRDHQLDDVRRALGARDLQNVPVVLAVGPPGAGKSAFAVRAAHQVRADYPDGVFHAKLQRADGTVVPASEILANFLGALGAPKERVSGSLEEMTRLFRNWTSSRRVLVVLDDVVDIHQLHPVLPSGRGCAVIVASRRLLSHPAIVLTSRVTPLDEQNSLALLTDLLGAERLKAEEDDLRELSDLCGGLPLVLRSAADLLQLRPHWSARRLLTRVRGDVQRMSMLAADGPSIADSVERSYRLLPPADQWALRLVAASAGQQVTLQEAAMLLDVDEAQAEVLLEDLVEFQLAEACEGGDEAFRYGIRSLFRAVAQSLTTTGKVPQRRQNSTMLGLGRLDSLTSARA